MTKSDVATLLRCSERTIERQVKLNAFPPPQRFGKESLWFQSIVFAWLEKRRQQQQQWVAGVPPVPPVPAEPEALPAPTSTAKPKARAQKKAETSRAEDWPGAVNAQPRFQCAAH
jgi:predicted DNA-binding transcriptional regulator AlpA